MRSFRLLLTLAASIGRLHPGTGRWNQLSPSAWITSTHALTAPQAEPGGEYFPPGRARWGNILLGGEYFPRQSQVGKYSQQKSISRECFTSFAKNFSFKTEHCLKCPYFLCAVNRVLFNCVTWLRSFKLTLCSALSGTWQ